MCTMYANRRACSPWVTNNNNNNNYVMKNNFKDKIILFKGYWRTLSITPSISHIKVCLQVLVLQAFWGSKGICISSDKLLVVKTKSLKIKAPFHSEISFSLCSCSWMFELHCAEWCMCRVWHEKAVIHIHPVKVEIVLIQNPILKRWACEHDLWHHKSPVLVQPALIPGCQILPLCHAHLAISSKRTR